MNATFQQCPVCSGTGYATGHDARNPHMCPRCPGSGTIYVHARTLEGWSRPLSPWLSEAIAAGVIVVKKAKGYEFLIGRATNPDGTIVEFQ